MKNKIFLMFFSKKILYLIIFIMTTFLLPKTKNKKNIKVCLCSIGKQENVYITELVNHYKKLGSYLYL